MGLDFAMRWQWEHSSLIRLPGDVRGNDSTKETSYHVSLLSVLS